MIKPEFSFSDILIILLLLLIFISWAKRHEAKYIQANPYYRYFTNALIYKLLGGLSFALVYMYYYGGGDSIDYWTGAVALKNLFFKSPAMFMDQIFGEMDKAKFFSQFDSSTGYPPTSLYKRSENYFVCRFTSFFTFFTFSSFLGITLVYSFLSFLSLWKLYKVFVYYFPGSEKQLSWAVLFLPSVSFWGSGIMKDTIMMAATCSFVYYLFMFFVIKDKQRNVRTVLYIILSAWFIYQVKPYVLIALTPGILFWFNFQALSSIENRAIRYLVMPFLVITTMVGGFSLYMQSGTFLGEYSSDKVFVRAAITQQDLLREEQYGGNSFNIGTFDPTPAGVASKAPQAIIAGFYRPFIWEAGSVVMILSGLENLILLILTLVLLIRSKIIGFISYTFSNPILPLCLIFSLMLAFSIGLSTANFGALVRYKLPLLPFFGVMLLMISQKQRTDARNKAKTPKKELDFKGALAKSKQVVNPNISVNS